MVEEVHYKKSHPVGAESPVFLSQLSWHCPKLAGGGGDVKCRKLVCSSVREPACLGGGLGSLRFLPSPVLALF